MPETLPQNMALGSILAPLNLVAVNAPMEGEGADNGPRYQVPEWIQLVPAGPLVKGIDGRMWVAEDMQQIMDDTRLPIALDWEHGSVSPYMARSGAAAARIVELDLRSNEIWGRCEWTAKGYASVEAGEYLYISPVFKQEHNWDGPSILEWLLGAGLVNIPNLDTLPSLNLPETHPMADKNDDKNKTGTSAGTTEPAATVQNAPEGTTEPAAGQPQIDMVPRAELEAALQQVNTMAEQVNEMHRREQERDKTARELAINTALDAAITARKILPTSREYYAAQCRAEGGLDAFQQHISTLPQMLQDSGLDDADPPASTLPGANAGTGTPAGTPTERPNELTQQQIAFCATSGLNPESYLATLQERYDKERQAAFMLV